MKRMLARIKETLITRNLTLIILLLLKSAQSVPNFNKESVHSRQKRILWVTADGRLALPPGTTLVVTPSLSMPFVRHPPEGFQSNLSIQLPFTIDFDKLGLTDNENPYGVLPPLLARSMGRAAGGLLADYIGSFMKSRRDIRSVFPKPPEKYKHAFHGGERALLYMVVEDFLEQFGMNGKACLLRAICEVHSQPLTNMGLLGEMAKLFLTASKSPYAKLLKDYVEAEYAGSGKAGGPAECWPYMEDCPKSLFLSKHNKYSSPTEENEVIPEEHKEEEIQENDSKVTYNPTYANM